MIRRELLLLGAVCLLSTIGFGDPARAAVFNVTCTNSTTPGSSDVGSINNAITLATQSAPAGGGAVVQLAPGICAVGGVSIELQSNVWLRGSGLGKTIMQQKAFSNVALIQANNVYINQSAGLTNVKITDMTIDGGDLATVSLTLAQAAPAGSATLALGSVPSTVIAQMTIRDVTHPASLPDYTTVQSVSADRTGIVLTAPTPSYPGVSAGDTLLFYTAGANLDAEFVTGLLVDRVALIRASGLVGFLIQQDTNFVVSNCSISVSNPDPQVVGGLFASGPNGFLFNNVLTNTSMALGGIHLVVAHNTIIPGYGTGVVSAVWAPQGAPLPQNNVFSGNIIHNSQLGANHDNMIAGGLEIWDSNSLITGNVIYNNGAQGIFSGGPNNIISHNSTYDNVQSPLAAYGNSGIVVAAGANIPKNTIVTNNISCNTNGHFDTLGPASCLTSQNTGSQFYALYMGLGATDTNVGPNTFHPGRVSGAPIAGTYTPASSLPDGLISATPCTLSIKTGSCTSTLQWSATNAKNLAIWVVNSGDPSKPVQMAASAPASGSVSISWLQDKVYVFELVSDAGILSSVSIQPKRS